MRGPVCGCGGGEAGPEGRGAALPAARVPTSTSWPSFSSPPTTSVALPSLMPRRMDTAVGLPSAPSTQTRPAWPPPRPDCPWGSWSKIACCSGVSSARIFWRDSSRMRVAAARRCSWGTRFSEVNCDRDSSRMGSSFFCCSSVSLSSLVRRVPWSPRGRAGAGAGRASRRGPAPRRRRWARAPRPAGDSGAPNWRRGAHPAGCW